MLIETLTEEETRVLGTLLEKSLATPDYYPMTLNALRNACNQKSSRDPITEYDDDTVSLALSGLKRKCLVAFIPYGSQGNACKYRHFLEDVRFNLRKENLAVLAVLLLRGSQTLNEVRLRASLRGWRNAANPWRSCCRSGRDGRNRAGGTWCACMMKRGRKGREREARGAGNR